MLRIIIFLTLLVGSTFANAALHVLFLNGISGDVEKSTNAVIAIRSIINESGLSDRFGGVQYGRIFNPNDGFTEDNIELDLQAFLNTWAIEDAKRLDPSAKMGGSLYKAFLGKTYYDGITNGVSIFNNYPEARARVFSVVKNAARQIDSLLNSGHQVIVISHSQGNFHAEAVDAYLRYGKSSAESVLYDTNMRFVGAASVAASTPNGRYVSITEDIALKLHRARRTNIDYDILPPTITMCLSGGFCAFNESSLLAIDATIHGFVEIYTAIPLYGTELLTGNVVAPFRVLANLIEASRSELQGGGVFLGSNGHRYQTITCGTWSQCRDAAATKGGQLVTIRSQAENNWLVSTFPMTEHYWIGTTNYGVADAWRWVSGAAFNYTNWGNNLNNLGGNENCAHFYSVTPGFWNDLRCDSPDVTKAIVEYLPNGYQGKTSWDLAGDFTTRTNPSGLWGFGYRMNSLSAVQSLLAPKSNCSDLRLTCWLMSATAPDIPFVGANLNDGTLVKRTIIVAPNEVVLHPGMNGEQAVVAWKAPSTGNYRIKGTFQVVDVIPTGVNVAIDQGLASIYSAFLDRAKPSGNFDFNRQFAKDEVIYFSVDAAGNYGNDSTALSITISRTAGSGSITVLAYTIPGATLTVPSGASTCTFNSTGTWSAGPQAAPQYQNADGVIGGTSYNLTNFGVPMPAEANMALVVKHSSTGKWDLLGSSKTISVVVGETLSFMMNDATTFGYTDGNTGQLSTVWSCN